MAVPRDLLNKLDGLQGYYNDVRAHSSLEMKTPTTMAFDVARNEKHGNSLYQSPAAARCSISHKTGKCSDFRLHMLPYRIY
ncbi:MAG: hypothetical protein ACI9YR_002511 [Bacteroidia bacterium]|jgi:hypothetical protein